MITVVLPTHNPREDIRARTLNALKAQSLEKTEWSMLVVDNASAESLSNKLLNWHPGGRVVREEKLGLTHARLRAINEADDGLIVWVDDDNILVPDYLEKARDAIESSPKLGAAGGRSLPEYEETPPSWYRPGLAPLGCRDLGDQRIVASWNAEEPEYPAASPIGAGMVVRREAILAWAEAVKTNPLRQALGRTGASLTSGEDNDINLTLLRAGWDLGYIPQLSLTHIIPPGRLTLDYQKRMARVSFRDFIRVLDIHGIRPWSRIPWGTLAIRKAKAWLTHKAWRGPAETIRWHGAMGQFEGRALLDSPVQFEEPQVSGARSS